MSDQRPTLLVVDFSDAEGLGMFFGAKRVDSISATQQDLIVAEGKGKPPPSNPAKPTSSNTTNPTQSPQAPGEQKK